MKTKLNLKFNVLLTTIALLFTLTSCGTLVREVAAHGAYRGVRSSFELLHVSAYLPIMAVGQVLTLPVDAAVDTVLLPYDLYEASKIPDPPDTIESAEEYEVREALPPDEPEPDPPNKPPNSPA